MAEDNEVKNMAEDNIDYEQRGREMLTPKQRVMSESRATILGPLDEIDLSEAEKAVVAKYADKVGELAGREMERLQAESPIMRIVRAMEEYLPKDSSNHSKRLGGVQSVARMAEKWQSAVREEQGLALLQGRQASQQEVIGLLSDLQDPTSRERFPIGATVFVAEGISDQDKLNTQFLHHLGVLPKETDVGSLFKLPSNDWNFSRDKAAIDQAILDGKPTRILGGNTVIGLRSNQLPGVQFRVDKYQDRLSTSVQFTPEAVARSITVIPGVKV